MSLNVSICGLCMLFWNLCVDIFVYVYFDVMAWFFGVLLRLWRLYVDES